MALTESILKKYLKACLSRAFEEELLNEFRKKK